MKRTTTIVIIIFITIALLPVMLARDYTPSNELRYLNIVDEMIDGAHPFAMSDHSVPYADKPPLYFWFASLMKMIAGRHYMFLLTLLSFVPAIVIAFVMDRWTGERLTPLQRSAATLMLFSTAYFLASSMVLRMDMLMCMFIVLSLYTFHKIYLNKKGARDRAAHIKSHESANYQKDTLLLPVFVFLAIFSKGAVGFLVPVISIIVFLISERDWRIRRYLGLRFWGILILLCALWFTGVYIDGGKEYFNNLLFHQTVDRAVNSFHHKEPFWYYLVAYWYIFAPWCVLIFVSFFVGAKGRFLGDSTSKLFICIAATTFVMLSIISSKIAIYMLPAIPFFVYAAVLQLSGAEKKGAFKFAIGFAAVINILIFAGALLAKPVLGCKFDELPKLWAPYWLITIAPAAGGVYALIKLKKNDLSKAIISVTTTLFILFYFIGLSTNKINPLMGVRAGSLEAAELAVEKNMDLRYYKYDKMVNLDHYFKQKNMTISKIEIEEMQGAKGYILFFREKEIRRDSVFAAFMKGREYNRYGDNICSTVIE